MRKTHTAVVPPRRASTKFNLSRATHATHIPRTPIPAAPAITIQHGVHPMIFEDALSFAENKSFELTRRLTASQCAEKACLEAIKATESELNDTIKKRTALIELAETRIQVLQSKLESVESIVAEAQCDAAENSERLQDALALAQERTKDLETRLEAQATRLTERFEARIKALNAAHQNETLQFARRSEELKLERDQWQARTEKAYTHAANAGRRAVDEIASAAAAEHVSIRIYEATKARLLTAENRAEEVIKECKLLQNECESLRKERAQGNLGIDKDRGAENDAKIEQLNDVVAEKNRIINELEATIKSHEATIKSREATVESREARIESLKATIESLKARIESLEAAIESHADSESVVPLSKHNSVCIKLSDVRRQCQAEKQAREAAEEQVASLKQDLQTYRQRILSAKKTLIPRPVEKKATIDKGDAARRRAEYSENLRRRNKLK